MKHIIFFALLFITLPSFAQTVTVDSSVTFSQGGKFWKQQTIIYDNGESLVSVKLLGDTATTINAAANRMRQQAATWANDVRFILTLKRQFNELVRQAADVKAVVGVDPLAVLYADSLVFQPGWQINSGSGNQPLVFNTNAQGQLRYNIAGGTNRNAFYFGDVIQFRNFAYATGLTGVTVNFYRRADGKYSDLLQNHILIPPGL
jgi:hypothetical protein